VGAAGDACEEEKPPPHKSAESTVDKRSPETVDFALLLR
jgi:hypothetical protein